MKTGKILISVAASAVMALVSTSSYANLILLGETPISGTGLGAVNTILTIQSPGNSSFESGSVGLAPGGAQVLTGNAKPSSTVLPFSALGITDASHLRVIFNAAEPGANSIILDSLVLNMFNPIGELLFNTSYTSAPHTFANTFSGTGNTGFAFALDEASAAAMQSLLSLPGAGNFLLGLSASASMATGGQETFFMANAISPVPEPETYALMLAGLGLMGFVGRRRAKKSFS